MVVLVCLFLVKIFFFLVNKGNKCLGCLKFLVLLLLLVIILVVKVLFFVEILVLVDR